MNPSFNRRPILEKETFHLETNSAVMVILSEKKYLFLQIKCQIYGTFWLVVIVVVTIIDSNMLPQMLAFVWLIKNPCSLSPDQTKRKIGISNYVAFGCQVKSNRGKWRWLLVKTRIYHCLHHRLPSCMGLYQLSISDK